MSQNTVPVIMSVMPIRAMYTNWKGERALRTITPVRVFFDSNQWHREPQWLLEAHDEDKMLRDLWTFSFKGLGWPTSV